MANGKRIRRFGMASLMLCMRANINAFLLYRRGGGKEDIHIDQTDVDQSPEQIFPPTPA